MINQFDSVPSKVRLLKMNNYRKKPVVITAIQYTGKNINEILKFTDSNAYIDLDGNLMIKTLEGEYAARIGDYIIRGIKGEFYPCKPDIFYNTYESCDD